MRIGKPAGLHGRIAAEDAAGITGKAQPELEFGAGPQPRVADNESPPAACDEDQQAEDGCAATASYHPLFSHHIVNANPAPATKGCRRKKDLWTCW